MATEQKEGYDVTHLWAESVRALLVSDGSQLSGRAANVIGQLLRDRAADRAALAQATGEGRE